MALKTHAGQIVQNKQVNIPVINFKSLGLTEKGKAYKQFFQTAFVPLGRFVPGEDGSHFDVAGLNTVAARFQIFKYSWSQPNPEKPYVNGVPQLMWRSEMWADSNLRIADGDIFDDPGVALGLTLKQDAQKKQPGLHGAPDGIYTMIEPYTQTVRIPVIWNVKVLDSGDIDTKSGELVWLELSFYHYESLMSAINVYDKQITQVLRKQRVTPNPDRLFVVQYTKDPKADMKERNSLTLLDTIDPNDWTKTFSSVSDVEYVKMIDHIAKRYNFYQSAIDELLAGKIDAATASSRVHAAIAEKLLVGWGEIDAESGMSVDEINELFISLIPQYSVDMQNTQIPESAIKEKKVIDLGSDIPF